MADSKSLAVVVIGGIFAFITSPVWGPSICRAVNVCDEAEPTQSSGPTVIQPTQQQPPTLPPFTIIPNAETNVFLSKTSGPAGSSFNVSGEGFQPGETVIITMQTNEIGRTTASAAGSFSGVEVTVPQELGVFAPRQFHVTARGQSSIRFAQAPFTVSG